MTIRRSAVLTILMALLLAVAAPGSAARPAKIKLTVEPVLVLVASAALGLAINSPVLVEAARAHPTHVPKPTATPRPTSTPTPTPSPSATPAPLAISHIIVIWMENTEVSSVSATSMPYLYGLSSTYARASQFYSVSHPSLPNYLAFWSGSTQGVTNDADYNFAGDNLSAQMSKAGFSWRTYAQDYPASAGCHTAASYVGGIDGAGVAGTYARKHNPAMSFTSVSGTALCADIMPLAAFDPSVNLAFVVPNLCNDMHDCSATSGDAFLSGFLPLVLNAPDWAHTALVVSFDEGTSNLGGGGHVFTMVARPGLSGVVSNASMNHYSLLAAIERNFGLPCLSAACTAAPMTGLLP